LALQANLATEAPAIQLAEHAQAILEDDARLGFQRNDRVLERLAKGSAHAVPLAGLFFCVIYCDTPKFDCVVSHSFPE
jgi:hypothetical protein